ncbi:hypothetical protein JVT61DRAFT_2315 [Boletus reticuloceps]|uniref:Uncharacterized protein n=1 Tax=Boletus reticuloceps TaxID=495285 RepID=A0A8I2YQH5_9AGAM|nr:hypothetical protein JVT61DRAFT_2315 [Boletus reticuloceps]
MNLPGRVATFFASASLSGAFSGLLAAAIDEINGKSGRPHWAWIFILVGRHTALLGEYLTVMTGRDFHFPVWNRLFFLASSFASKARFLSGEEHAYVVSRLKEDGAVSQDDKNDSFSWREVIESARSPHVWLLAIALFFNGDV